MSTKDFQKIQALFTHYLRDPKNSSIPFDIEPRRIKIYETLVFNNLNTMITNCFRVIHEILDGDEWQHLIRQFLIRHHSPTPYFRQVPKEFLAFLTENPKLYQQRPYLLELAHYEWIELELSLLQDDSPQTTSKFEAKQMETATLSISPLAMSLSYHYPVHKIGKDYQPEEQPSSATYLIVYRDNEEKVHFTEVNSLIMRLLALIEQQPNWTATQILEAIVTEVHHPKPDVVRQGGYEAIRSLVDKQILIPAAHDESAYTPSK